MSITRQERHRVEDRESQRLHILQSMCNGDKHMPIHLRSAHTAANNTGIYPYNGALRIRVERSCADRMIRLDGSWCHVVGNQS